MSVSLYEKTTTWSEIYTRNVNLMSRLLFWIMSSLLFEILVSNSIKAFRIVFYKRIYEIPRQILFYWKELTFLWYTCIASKFSFEQMTDCNL